MERTYPKVLFYQHDVTSMATESLRQLFNVKVHLFNVQDYNCSYGLTNNPKAVEHVIRLRIMKTRGGTVKLYFSTSGHEFSYVELLDKTSYLKMRYVDDEWYVEDYANCVLDD